MRFGAPAVSRGVARTASRPAAPADNLDIVLGPGEAKRVRNILEHDAKRLASAPVRRPLSRGYRESPGAIPALTAAQAAKYSEAAVRESLERRQAAASGVDVERVLAAAGSERMGALFERELETVLRTRVAGDGDFDMSRFPNAARRFGQS